MLGRLSRSGSRETLYGLLKRIETVWNEYHINPITGEAILWFLQYVASFGG